VNTSTSLNPVRALDYGLGKADNQAESAGLVSMDRGRYRVKRGRPWKTVAITAQPIE
jgi:hypothetical protein